MKILLKSILTLGFVYLLTFVFIGKVSAYQTYYWNGPNYQNDQYPCRYNGDYSCGYGSIYPNYSNQPNPQFDCRYAGDYSCGYSTLTPPSNSYTNSWWSWWWNSDAHKIQKAREFFQNDTDGFYRNSTSVPVIYLHGQIIHL